MNHKKFLVIVLFMSLFLNSWGINFGVPGRYKADEITLTAQGMVKSRTVNHHYYAYGSFHYFPIMAMEIISTRIVWVMNKLFDLDLNNWSKQIIFIILSRAVSAFMGTGIVLIVYLIARLLFDNATALLAAILSSVSMGLVHQAHFASVDIPMIFWFSLSCLMATYVFLDGSRKWYILAGLFSGLAAAVKYNGIVAVMTLVVAHLLSNTKNNRSFVMGLGMVGLGFIGANPVIFTSFFEWIDGVFKENIFNSLRLTDQPYAFIPQIKQLKNALGIPLFLATICGLLYSLKLLMDNASKKKVSLVWSMILPFYLLMGSMHLTALAYVVLFIPFLAILTGKFISDFLRAKPPILRWSSWILVCLVTGYSLLYSIASDLTVVNDSRTLTSEWVVKHVRDGAHIEMTPYGPNIDADKYRVTKRPIKNSWMYSTVELAQSSDRYRISQKLISSMKNIAEGLGFNISGPSYTAHYERAIQNFQKSSADFNLGVSGLKERDVDYLIVSEWYYARFWENWDSAEDKVFDSSTQGQFYNLLFSGKTSYRKIAEFKYQFSKWINPRTDANPQIYVFARE